MSIIMRLSSSDFSTSLPKEVIPAFFEDAPPPMEFSAFHVRVTTEIPEVLRWLMYSMSFSIILPFSRVRIK